jgi:type II secretory pathway component PulF
MAVFTYQALNTSARDIRGTIAADSPREARDKLRSGKGGHSTFQKVT